MMNILSELAGCLIAAAILGFLIGYILGKRCEDEVNQTH